MNAPHAQEAGHPAPGPVAAHFLGYADLATALLEAWQRTVVRQLLGAVLAVGGICIGTLLLTFAAIAAAWPTGWRWPVTLGVAGLYLLLAVIGAWLVLRRPAVPSPVAVLVGELRKDVQVVSAALHRPAP